MPITPTAERTGPYSIRYSWTGTAPYDVYVNGELRLNDTTATSLIVQFPDEAVPHAIEVRDATSTGEADNVRANQRIRLQWRGQTDARYYNVERYDGADWIVTARVMENGTGYYSHTTQPEADATTVQYRVVAVDGREYESVALEQTQYVVCLPAPPAVTGTYDGGTGNLTIAEAS